MGTDFVNLNRVQMSMKTPELLHPAQTSTPYQWEDVSPDVCLNVQHSHIYDRYSVESDLECATLLSCSREVNTRPEWRVQLTKSGKDARREGPSPIGNCRKFT
ncbi:hypothetical protein AVEN_75822-1 [Araneus ventricosus]|uniref:Uncharacterized protein n=1 Tax=Araneus ventricosus TaxID=182803 RepID=A0A4Y2KD19_ARAVE|nr:hypothetical protein AVEN_75822-1 [Araneus ventricosus]